MSILAVGKVYCGQGRSSFGKSISLSVAGTEAAVVGERMCEWGQNNNKVNKHTR